MGEFVARRAADMGATIELRQVLSGRPNVYCCWGRRDNVGLMLQTHLDTVAPSTPGQLKARVEGHRVYGRGACDAKASLAAMLLACGTAGARRGKSVLLAAVCDEEDRFRGVQALVRRGWRARLAAVGEPTGLKPALATRGCVRFQVKVRGKAAHSSTPLAGVNAVSKACALIEALGCQLAARLERTRHPLVGGPCLSVTRIRGGAEVNVIPDSCSFHVDRRLVPGETPEEAVAQVERLIAELKGADADLCAEVQSPCLFDPALDQEASDPAVRVFLGACRRVLGAAETIGVPFGTDASKLAQSGLPTVVFGPGSLVQAHSADEWVDAREVALAARVYAEVASTL